MPPNDVPARHRTTRGASVPSQPSRTAQRVMVTCAATEVGRSIIEKLVARGTSVVGVGTEAAWVDGPDVIYQVPPAGHPGRPTALRRIAVDEGIKVVIPASSAELGQLAAARSGFDEHIDVVVPSPGPAAIVADRLFTSWQLLSRHVSTPDVAAPGDFRTAAAAFDALGSPIVLRSRFSRPGATGAMVLGSTAELDAADPQANQFLQRHVPGTDYRVVSYRPRTKREGSALSVVLEQISMNQGTPHTRRVTGNAASDINRLAVAAIRAIGLVGPCEVAIRRLPDETLSVLHVRAGFSMASADVPEQLTQVLTASGVD